MRFAIMFIMLWLLLLGHILLNQKENSFSPKKRLNLSIIPVGGKNE